MSTATIKPAWATDTNVDEIDGKKLYSSDDVSVEFPPAFPSQGPQRFITALTRDGGKATQIYVLADSLEALTPEQLEMLGQWILARAAEYRLAIAGENDQLRAH
ncbi:hypothetical protein [Pengzhenrongella sp.]|jgi:hypothetical protein|uniref:hypothetical protein n=1 Tax=Pengzhenrongella sp. TaxID=2888820 RepID=UPI002F9307FA